MGIHTLRAACALTLLCATLTAQNISGTLSGSIQDSTGGAIPNIEVTLSSDRTGFLRATRTNESGLFTFPDLTLRGANSVIEAHGNFDLNRRELDFKAKVFPFQESQSLLKSVVGAVLTPFSNIFEVKLSGTLDKPDWSFVASPTNFLRSLAPADTAPTPAPPLEHPTPTPSASALPKP
jgi:autotransporter translocation and assembly factor TamB